MKYGKTDIEGDVEATVMCREIVKEILRFGVTDYQKIKIVELLGLELENREQMLKIIEASKSCLESKTKNNSKLITLE